MRLVSRIVVQLTMINYFLRTLAQSTVKPFSFIANRFSDRINSLLLTNTRQPCLHAANYTLLNSHKQKNI